MSIKNLVEKAAMLDFLLMKGDINPLKVKVDSLSDQDRQEYDAFIESNQKEVFYFDKETNDFNPLWSIAAFFKSFYDAEPNRVIFLDYWDEYELDNLLPDNIDEVEEKSMIDFLKSPYKNQCDMKKRFLESVVKNYDCNNTYDWDTMQHDLFLFIKSNY